MTEEITGRVLRSTGSWYMVAGDNGKIYECRLKGKFRTEGLRSTNPIAVGDIVDYMPDDDALEGVITNIHERSNYIVRKATKLTSATHIIASNIDQFVIIATLDKPRTKTGFIDRMLSTAEAYHIPSVIVFNKFDLYKGKKLEKLESLKKAYSDIGYQTIITSVVNKMGIEDFREVLRDKTSLISGHSGVGKSALINAIDNNLDLKTGNISSYTNKGTHTTTFANMFKLEIGGMVIDTPGIKEFGLVNFDKKELGHRFPEIRKFMQYCRFNDCLHINEPGCAVIDAVEKQEIEEFRYKNYLNILETI